MAKKTTKSNFPASQALPKKSPETGQSEPKSVTSGGFYRYFGWMAAALGLLLYLNTTGHAFCYDDSSAIAENTLVQGGLKKIGTIFSTEYRYGYDVRHHVGSLYRPLSLAMFAAEWQLSPNNPGLHHIINVLLFALTGWLLWRTWHRILHRHSPAMVGAAVLLFMAHPVHTEVVANIKSRDEILALLFSTAALHGLFQYFDKNKLGWLLAALVFYGLALFSKESAITFLAIFPLATWFFTEKPLANNLRINALFLLPAMLFLAVRASVLGAQPSTGEQAIVTNFIPFADGVAGQLASAFMMCLKYLQVLLFPHPLVCDIGYPQMKPVGFSDWRALLGLLAFLGMGIWAFVQLPRKHFLAFAVLFFLVAFSLFSNVLYHIGTNYGERLLYAPSLGFAFALAWALHRFLAPGDPNSGKSALFWPISLLVVVLYGFKTINRNPAWKDDFTLHTTDIQTSPNSAHLNFGVGKQYVNKGYDKKRGQMLDTALVRRAIDSYSKSIALYDGNYEAYGERAWANVRLKRYDAAYGDYLKVLEMNPNHPQTLSALGYLCRNFRNEPDRAEELYRKAIAADPRFVEPRRNLGALLATKRQFEEALKIWQEALALAPNDRRLHELIGQVYGDMGNAEESKKWLEKAAKLRE